MLRKAIFAFLLAVLFASPISWYSERGYMEFETLAFSLSANSFSFEGVDGNEYYLTVPSHTVSNYFWPQYPLLARTFLNVIVSPCGSGVFLLGGYGAADKYRWIWDYGLECPLR